jgi:hypothetical protein
MLGAMLGCDPNANRSTPGRSSPEAGEVDSTLAVLHGTLAFKP